MAKKYHCYAFKTEKDGIPRVGDFVKRAIERPSRAFESKPLYRVEMVYPDLMSVIISIYDKSIIAEHSQYSDIIHSTISYSPCELFLVKRSAEHCNKVQMNMFLEVV